jgi:hypothetical protein
MAENWSQGYKTFFFLSMQDKLECLSQKSSLHHHTQHNDFQHKDTRHNDIQHKNKYNATLSIMTLSMMAFDT